MKDVACLTDEELRIEVAVTVMGYAIAHGEGDNHVWNGQKLINFVLNEADAGRVVEKMRGKGFKVIIHNEAGEWSVKFDNGVDDYIWSADTLPRAVFLAALKAERGAE